MENSNRHYGLQRAYKNKIISKDKALKMVAHLRKELGDNTSEDTWEALGCLERFFAPKENKGIQKDNMKWLMIAVGRNESRSAIEYVQVKGGLGVSTDGRRLHQCPIDKPDGYYHYTGTYLTDAQYSRDVGKFPNTSAFTSPKTKGFVPLTEELTTCKVSDYFCLRGSKTRHFCVSERLLNELTCGETTKVSFNPERKLHEEQESLTGFIVFKSGERAGVLMPITVSVD